MEYNKERKKKERKKERKKLRKKKETQLDVLWISGRYNGI